MADEKLNLTQKLLNAQAELKAPKGQYNNFGKYKYRSAEDILEAVKPINAKHGVLLTITDEPVLIGDWHYIKATATVTDGSDSLVVTAYARESETKKGQDLSQITGTASSYARKYALNGLYLIDDTKDADTDEYTKQAQPKRSAPQKTSPQPSVKPSTKDIGELKTKVNDFSELMKTKGKEVTPDMVLETLGITGFDSLSLLDIKEALNKLNTWSKK